MTRRYAAARVGTLDRHGDDAAATRPARIPGPGIVVTAWAGNVVFGGVAIPAAAGVESIDRLALGVEIALFFASIGVWTWAFLISVVRSARGDDIAVASLFLFQGPVPRRVRAHLFGATAVAVAIAAGTAAADPFAVLVPMLPLGLLGLWGARHGAFPPRRSGGGRSDLVYRRRRPVSEEEA